MIDIESMIFTPIATALRTDYKGIFVTGEYVPAPAQLPAVSIVEIDNTPDVRTQTNINLENHAVVMYQVDVYSNLSKGKKAQCKAIIAMVDELFAQYGFTRTYLNPVPNMNDATIYRMVARYGAVVGKDHTIYRR